MQKSYLLPLFLLAAITLIFSGCSSVGDTSKAINNLGDDKKLLAANANIQLGLAYLQKSDVLLAKQKFLMAIDLAPQYPPVWYTMAYYLEVTGNNEKANEYYLRAIDLAPNSGDPQNNYGTFLCHTGKEKESVSHFLLATKDPNYIDTASAYENAGLCALLIPDEKSAKQYFTQAITQDPNKQRSLVKLATIDYHEKKYQEANNLIQQALRLDPSSPEALALQKKLK